MPDRTSYAPGTPRWIDLSTDAEAAIPFYTGLFGSTAFSLGDEAGGYGFFLHDGKQAAGFGPQQNPGPPVWSSYITVEDVGASAAAVTAAGGTVVMPPMDVPAGRFALVQDPQGGMFAVIRLAEGM